MSVAMYFVIAAIVTVFIAAVGIKILRNKSSVDKQTYEHVCDAVLLTVGSIVVGAGWVVLLPAVVFGYVIYRLIRK